MKDKLRLALLISGEGTTARAIIEACKSGHLDVNPVCVVLSAPNTNATQKMLELGMATENIIVIDPKVYSSAQEFGEVILAVCKTRGVDLVDQCGWMPKTPANVIAEYRGMMINQHPGPLDPGRPDFGGKGMFGRRVHCARLWFVRQDKQEFWTEASVQRVGEEFDAGALLKTKRIVILPDDDPYSLRERLLPVEHELQIEVLGDFASGSIQELPPRESPLVLPEKESLLQEAKRIAQALFPLG